IALTATAKMPAISPILIVSPHFNLAIAYTSLRLFFRQPLANDALRPEDQHEHEHGEGNHVFKLMGPGDVQPFQKQGWPHRFDQPQEEAAQGRTRHAANAAQYSGREGFNTRHEAHEKVYLAKDERIEYPGRAGPRCRRSEGDGNRAVYVNTHERRHVFVLGHWP